MVRKRLPAIPVSSASLPGAFGPAASRPNRSMFSAAKSAFEPMNPYAIREISRTSVIGAAIGRLLFGGSAGSARSALLVAQPEVRQLRGLRPPDLALAEDPLDQPLDHAHPRRPADDLRVAEPVVEAALLVHPLE